jgi:hypothetical protein
MKLTLISMNRTLAAAAVCWVAACPVTSDAADRTNPSPRVAPMGVPIQQVNYNYNGGNGSCPNGDCQGGTRGWNNNGGANRGWGGGYAHGHSWHPGCLRCQHGLVQGNSFVRPPAVWPVASTPNTYQYYWAPQLMGVPAASVQPAAVYPMIYHPTDTTQLGFSYQHVPRWGYRPEMLPPAPTPYWPLGQHTAYGSGYGSVESYGTTTPTTVTSPVTPASPVTPSTITPTPVTPVAPINVPPPPEAQSNSVESNTAVFPGQGRR